MRDDLEVLSRSGIDDPNAAANCDPAVRPFMETGESIDAIAVNHRRGGACGVIRRTGALLTSLRSSTDMRHLGSDSEINAEAEIMAVAREADGFIPDACRSDNLRHFVYSAHIGRAASHPAPQISY